MSKNPSNINLVIQLSQTYVSLLGSEHYLVAELAQLVRASDFYVRPWNEFAALNTAIRRLRVRVPRSATFFFFFFYHCVLLLCLVTRTGTVERVITGGSDHMWAWLPEEPMAITGITCWKLGNGSCYQKANGQLF